MSELPQERPANQKRDLISLFHDEYAKVYAEAQESATFTDTGFWQQLYSSNRDEEQQIARQLCKDLESMAQQIQLIGPTEDAEKEVGEIKKRLTALRERHEAFELYTVAPVKEPAEECRRVLEQYRTTARRQEQDAPLHNVGLEHLMADAISKVDKARWNAESGRVEIVVAGNSD